jgi:uncharacterized protein (TIGR02118 family)
MIKLVYCMRKRADISSEAFYKYWSEQHAPLVRSLAEATQAKKYVQSHTIEPEFNDALVRLRSVAEPYDGVAEVWFESIESFHSPDAREARKRLIEDEAEFIDFSRSSMFITEEHLIFDLS